MGKIIDATLRLIDEFTKPLGNAIGQLEYSAKTYQKAGRQIQKAGQEIAGTGTTMTKAVTIPVVGLGVAAVKTAADFETGMSKVKSISGATSKEIEKLSEKAKEMGAKTKFSATESADAFSYMAMAGWKTQDMLDGIEGIMYLAGASGEDLALTSDIVTDSLTAFGMTAKDTNRFVDVLAQTATNSNTNVALMGDTFKYVAPLAGALKYSTEDTAVAIGLMANSGLKAGQAGTALRSILTRMAKPTKESGKAMEDLGISLTDSQGNMKTFGAVMGDMRKGFSGLTEVQKTQYAAMIAGQEGMSGLLGIVNATDGDFQKLTNSINNSNGAAKNMYEIANDNLLGRLEELGGTLESVAITFGTKLMPYIEKGVGKLKELADKFGQLSDAQVGQIIHWGTLAATVGPVILIFGKIAGAAGTGIKKLGSLGIGIKSLKTNASAAAGVLSKIKMPSFHMPNGLSGSKKIFSGIGGAVSKLTSPFAAFGKGVARIASKSKILTAAGKGASKYFGGFGKIVGGVFSPFKKVAGIFGTTGKALVTLLGPANTVLLIIGLLIAAGVLLYKNWDKVVEAAKKVGQWVKSVFEACGFDIDFFKEKLSSSGGKFAEFVQKLQELWTVVKPVVTKIGEILGLVFGVVLGGVIGGAIGLIGSLFESFSSVFSGILTALGGVIDFITGVFTGNWEKAWNGIKDIFGGVFESLVALAKMPINGVISIINGAIAGINGLGLEIPDWVPKFGGQKFSINIPTIPMLYKGTSDWGGGPAMIHDKGAEIVDLPSGSRVYPHDKSMEMARAEGQKKISIVVQKIAEKIVVRNENDIDKIMDKLAIKLEQIALDMP